MTAQDCPWETIETAEAFRQLTTLRALVALMVHYPSPVYEEEHVEVFLRVLCLIAGIETEYVNWTQLTEAVLTWAKERGFDVVEERA